MDFKPLIDIAGLWENSVRLRRLQTVTPAGHSQGNPHRCLDLAVWKQERLDTSYRTGTHVCESKVCGLLRPSKWRVARKEDVSRGHSERTVFTSHPSPATPFFVINDSSVTEGRGYAGSPVCKEDWSSCLNYIPALSQVAGPWVSQLTSSLVKRRNTICPDFLIWL